MTFTLVASDASFELVPADQPLLSATDRGFTYGDGLFETIRVLNSIPLFLNRHLERLLTSLPILNLSIPWDSVALTQHVHSLIAANQISTGMLRLTITRGPGPRGFDVPVKSTPILIIQAAPLPPVPPPASAILAPWRIDPASPLTHLKSLSALDKIMAKDLARQSNAADAIFLNFNGHLTESTSSNLFLITNHQIVTPALSCGLLPGVTRQLLIELAPTSGQRIIETELTLDQLTSASEAFLTNAVGLRPLVNFNGQPIGTGQPGPVTAQLNHIYQQFCEAASHTQEPS